MKRATILSWVMTAAVAAVSLGVFGDMEIDANNSNLPELIVTPERSTALVFGDAIFEEFWGDDRPTYVVGESANEASRM
jgi:hypothetical protein